ncbi:MAG TPA: hypothetical protein ENJ95_07795 [Bacteroidetes bacterium]|nr:hypothetical protein [Bacteroidota bacterium]
MSEIKITIDNQYLRAFLDFLKTLNYVSVQEVKDSGQEQNGTIVQVPPLQYLPPDDPVGQAVRPLRNGVSVEDLISEQGYNGTDWKRLESLAKEMDIKEPIEQLLDGDRMNLHRIDLLNLKS